MIYNRATIHSKTGRTDTSIAEMDLDEADALATALRRLSPGPSKPAKIPFPTGLAFTQATKLLAEACLNLNPEVKVLAEAVTAKLLADEEIARAAATATKVKFKKTKPWKEAEARAKKALKHFLKGKKAKKAKKPRKRR